MRGVFGLLLIGGGVILLYGTFTGKITFPLTANVPGGGTTSYRTGPTVPGNGTTQQQTINRLLGINK